MTENTNSCVIGSEKWFLGREKFLNGYLKNIFYQSNRNTFLRPFPVSEFYQTLSKHFPARGPKKVILVISCIFRKFFDSVRFFSPRIQSGYMFYGVWGVQGTLWDFLNFFLSRDLFWLLRTWWALVFLMGSRQIVVCSSYIRWKKTMKKIFLIKVVFFSVVYELNTSI